MSIYIKDDAGSLTPLQVETTVEQLLKTRETPCEASPCVKANLEVLQAAAAPVETTSKTAPTSGDK